MALFLISLGMFTIKHSDKKELNKSYSSKSSRGHDNNSISVTTETTNFIVYNILTFLSPLKARITILVSIVIIGTISHSSLRFNYISPSHFTLPKYFVISIGFLLPISSSESTKAEVVSATHQFLPSSYLL